MNVNKVIIVGRLTRDPEKKAIPSGQTVTNFSIATSRKWKGNDGQEQEKTEFHNIVAWGKVGEIIAQYVIKGQEIYIEGRLETRNWEDQESGKKMYRTEIILENFQFGSKPGGAGDSQGSYQNQQSNATAPAVDANPNPTPTQAPAQEDVNIPAAEEIPTIDVDADTEEVKVEDIPF
jgi:single-strand DNA-binding protein